MNKIKKNQYTNILGWSISRYDRFLNCKRQYFYDYYPKFDNDVPFEKLQFLKKLTSKALEVGTIVHDIIRDILKRYQITIKPINKNKFFKYSFDMTKRYCNSKFFFEHYYNGEFISLSEIYIKVKNILENFFNSSRFAWIEKSAVSQSSQWVIEPEGFGETMIKNYKAFFKVDFIFPIINKLYIMDWKTGKVNAKKHSKQLTGYALWAHYYFGKNINDIVPIIAYLYPKYNELDVQISDFLILEFIKTVIAETKDMYEYLVNIEKNIPKDKKYFLFTDNLFFCKYCNYKEVCPKIKS
ncbi:MAG: PD-(D/E)XK nuclease family protein [Endomicrobium sp.]|jgi:hypothetical protein|nr:PD-(D/E)XK nuclease family protein [Endomicrobium sp.]